MAAPTFLDYFNAGKAEAIARRPDLTFDEGDISELYMAGLAAMADHLTGYAAGRFKALYLDGASGDDLTTLADDRYGIVRNAAQPAAGVLRFSRTAAPGSGVIAAGTVAATVKDSLGNETQVETLADLSFTKATDGGFTAPVHTGAGTGTVTPSGSVSAPINAQVLVVVPGGLGVGTFKFSTDGGASYGSEQTIPGGGSYTDASGAIATFGGTFTAGDVYNWRSLAYGPLDVTAQAIVAGSDGNVAVGALTRVVNTLFATFAVTNAARFAGGTEEETDEDLRERVRTFPTTVRRATLAALEYGALQIASVARAKAEEELNPLAPTNLTGLVNLYVTDSNGNSNPTMTSLVTTELRKWRAGGIKVNVLGGSLLSQNISVQIVTRAGFDTAPLVAKIQAAITARVAKLRIGESLTTDMIKQAVQNVDENILSVTVLNPTNTVAPTASQIIRAGTVTVS